MTAPRRHWFRFSLRTLFVVVTVFGIGLAWLGWELQLVRRRTALMDWARQNNLWSFFTVSEIRQKLPLLRASGSSDYPLALYEGVPQVSTIRRWLGDEALATMSFSEPPAVSKQEEFRAAFPETDFHCDNEGFDD